MSGGHVAWFFVVSAGLLEVVWALALKASDGLTKPVPLLVTMLALAGSLGLLALGMRELTVGTAYAVFVGVGVAGAVLVGGLVMGEALPPARLGFLVLLLVSLVGLKVTGDSPYSDERNAGEGGRSHGDDPRGRAGVEAVEPPT